MGSIPMRRSPPFHDFFILIDSERQLVTFKNTVKAPFYAYFLETVKI